VSVQLQSKPFSYVQTCLVELKTTLSLLSEVLTVAEIVFVHLVCFALTIIGALALLSIKIDFPHLLGVITRYFNK
jgi:hypothetical protein